MLFGQAAIARGIGYRKEVLRSCSLKSVNMNPDMTNKPDKMMPNVAIGVMLQQDPSTKEKTF